MISLQEQLEEKAKVVEQLINKDSEPQLEIDKLCNEHQLEIDKVCAENKPLKERLREESQSPPSMPTAVGLGNRRVRTRPRSL